LLLLLPCVFPCQVGSAYLHLGLQPKDRVGVFGANCPEWMLAMQGCNRTRCDDSQHAL
jgi:long-subunit acyl-CoA synthetase (AMP-forming)